MTASTPVKPNLGLFALVYVGCLIAAGVIAMAVAMFLNYELPSVTVGIVIFMSAALFAGSRYAKASNWAWTRGERHTLAWQYALTATVLQVVFAIVLVLALGSAAFGVDAATFFAPESLAILAVVTAISGIGYYVMARVMFGSLVKQQQRRQAQQAPNLNSDRGAGAQ